ncbi:DUF3558 family protein [Nocardia terpenica]|uniref:DUF3558 family protein n=1 Tax=Nocardia terpenica TaxID=455432 RepID=UPI002FE3CE2C
MRKWLGTACCLSAVALASGCSGTGDGDGGHTAMTVSPTAASRPSVSVSVKPMPTQSNQGRKAVSFDPCVQVGDATIAKSGFDPALRERSDQIRDSYSFVGCSFGHKESVNGQMLTVRTLTVWSTNITLDEFRSRDGANTSAIEVNGKDALISRTSADQSCSVETAGPDGALVVRNSVAGPLTSQNPCDGIQDVADVVDLAVAGK